LARDALRFGWRQKESIMAACGISLSPFSGIPYQDFAQLAREAEEAGFSGVFVPEANNDALMCCHVIAAATRRVTIATWIVNIYLRQPTLCAAGAAMVQEAAGGRFVLGLGVSHRPALQALHIEMGNAREKLRAYTTAVRAALSGDPISGFGLRFRQPARPIPIYFAALAMETARLGGEIADGLMLYLCSPERMRKSIAAARAEALRHNRKPADVAITMGLPVFLHDDRAQAVEAAKRGLAFYAALPFYNRLLANSGFAAEAARVTECAARRDFAGMTAALTEPMVDALALVGPPARCLDRLAEYRAAGAELPIIVPNPVGEDYMTCVRSNLRIFASA
jgi:alkanesulfonate monooxygenase SsuD/methylene tetrahydromethanopterin reductase-like flavin-dependent oxidoreductase (luciferase family)